MATIETFQPEKHGCAEFIPDWLRNFVARVVQADVRASQPKSSAEKTRLEDQVVLDNLEVFWPALLKLKLGAKVYGITDFPLVKGPGRETAYHVVVRIPRTNLIAEHIASVESLIRKCKLNVLGTKWIDKTTITPGFNNDNGSVEIIVHEKDFQQDDPFVKSLKMLEKNILAPFAD